MTGVLRAYNPVSWFHPKGIYRVLARLKPMLPDVGGSLFLTFTVNPALFESPQSAFHHARGRLRRVFFNLRRGVEWKGKTYRVNAPYCVKVEFHQDGRAHFHAVFLTRRYVPGELLTALWKLGRTDVRRINDASFRYLLKYVTKGGSLPEWVLDFKRLRIWQASKGFYRESTPVENDDATDETKEIPARRKRLSSTIGDRMERWARTAVLRDGKKFTQVILGAPFAALFSELIYAVALDGRYLGDGNITINDTGELIPWIQPRI